MTMSDTSLHPKENHSLLFVWSSIKGLCHRNNHQQGLLINWLSHEKGNLPTKSLHTNDWSYNMLLIVSWIAMDTRTDESSNFIGMHHNITQQRASSYVGLGNINHRMTQSQFELSTTCGCIPMTLITNAHRSIMLWPSNNKGKSDIAWVSKYYSLPTILWCKFWFENCLSFDGYQFNPFNCWCHVTESTVHHLPLT